MPLIESKLKTGTLTLGSTAFNTQATNVTLGPTIKETGDPLEVLSGDVSAPIVTTTWSLQITAIQDFTATAGFVNYCLTNNGVTVSFTWKPQSGTPAVTYTGTCIIRAADIGGDVATRLLTSVEFPLVTGPITAYA